MTETAVYRVPDMSCAHCAKTVEDGLRTVEGVEAASADVETKEVTVAGWGLEDGALRAAIAGAGYRAE